MATSGRPIPADDARRMQRLREIGQSIRVIAKETQTSTRTVQKYLRSARPVS